MSEATERDKALYQQIKDARGLYRGLAIVYLLILVACVIMAIACVITRKLHGILPLVGFASGAWFSASLAHIRYKDYASALEEIGPDPAGLDTCETYSETTAYAIETARMTKKELLQQWIAYSILTLTLLQSTMKGTRHKPTLAQILIRTCHGVTIVKKHDTLRLTKRYE